MNTPRDHDAVIGAWLDDGPQTLPAETRQAITVGIRTATRRPATGWPFGRLGLPTFDLRRLSVALGSAAVLVVAAVLELNFYVNQQGGIGALPSPTPSPSGTASYASGDREVTASTPSNWGAYWPGKDADGLASDVWFGLLWPGPGPCCHHISEVIGLVDPVAYDSWCAANGESPLLTGPAGATAISQKVIADPNFETTAPVAARVGGLDAVSIDVALAPGGEACRVQMIEISRWIHHLQTQPGTRLRLYLVDLPDGMSVETLAITVVAPEERFEEFIDETAPIIESIEFHPRVPSETQ